MGKQLQTHARVVTHTTMSNESPQSSLPPGARGSNWENLPPRKPMSREAQTYWIVGAIIGGMFACLLTVYLYNQITNPDLSNMSYHDRCEYWAFYKDRGGNPDTCKKLIEQYSAIYGY